MRFRNSIRRVRHLIFGAALLTASGNVAMGQGLGPNLGFGTQGGSASGLEDGLSSVSGFLPLSQPTNGSLVFLDGSMLVFNEQSAELGASIGMGYRVFNPTALRVFGGYAYHDHRDLGTADNDQVAFGFESLGWNWDHRLNVQLATSESKTTRDLFATFADNRILLNGVTMQPFDVVDGEIGRVMWRNDLAQFRGFGGVYGLFGGGDDTAGVRGRVELKVVNRAAVGGFIENDGVFGTTGGVTFSVRLGRGLNAPSDPAGAVEARLADAVNRRQYAVARTQFFQDEALTINGTPVYVQHARATATGGPGAAGSLTNPITDLTAYDTNADVLYLQAGTFSGQTLTVTNNGLRVWGDGFVHTITGDQGTFNVAPVSSAFAIIDAGPLAGIEVQANQVTIDGVVISNSPWGITSGSVQDLVLTRNQILNTDNGIFFSSAVTGRIAGNTIRNNAAGLSTSGIFSVSDFTGSITDNYIENFSGTGISIAGNLTGDLTDNTLLAVGQGGSQGVQINGNMTGDISRNQLQDVQGTGFLIIGAMDGNVQDNSFVDVGQAGGPGFQAIGNMTGDITGNYFENIQGGGVLLIGSMTGNVRDNTMLNVGQGGSHGLQAIGEFTGDITGNHFEDLQGGGFLLNNDFTGDFSDNTLLSVGAGFSPGVQIIGNATGNFRRNHIEDTGSAGLMIVGTLDGDIEDNELISTAQNGSPSIQVIGNVTGDISGNTLYQPTGGGFNAMLFNGSVTGDFTNNYFEGFDNGGGTTGVQIIGNLNGNFSFNSFVNNQLGTLTMINGTLNGNFSDNLYDGNQASTLVQFINSNGAISNNIFRNNTVTGFAGLMFNNHTGNVTGNEFRDVGDLNFSTLNGNVTNNQFLGNTAFITFTMNGNVSDNTFVGSGPFLWRAFAATTGDITNNSFEATAGGRVWLNYEGTVSNNTFLNVSEIASTGDWIGDFANNTIEGLTSEFRVTWLEGDFYGNSITAAAGGADYGVNVFVLIGNMYDNTVTGDFTDYGIYVNGPGGDIYQNVVTGSGPIGIGLGVGNGSVFDNSVSGNFDDSIIVSSLTGDVFNNSTSGGNNGLRVIGLNGSIYGNNSSNHVLNGIQITNLVTGSVTGNTTNNNGGDGINNSGTINGDVINNIANDNGDDGIDNDGTIGGAIAPNTTTGNGDQGIEN